MQRRGFTLVELMIVVVVIGILAAVAVPTFFRMRARAKEANVKNNAHLVQVAAEEFATQSGGVYATDDTTALPNGETLSDLTPNTLANPFGGANVVIWNGGAAAEGEVGYDSTGLVGVGYTIDGLGEGGTSIITLSNGG